ncbi:MAG: nucleoside hydrolase [Ilumatobacteraceae bacterium]
MSTKRLLFAATVAMLLLPVVASCGEQEGAGTAQRPLVVDTDVGADDAIALLFLLQDPDIDVRAITVSGTGLVRCDSGVAIAAGLVQLAGHGAIPIACGSAVPTQGSRAFPEAWRDQADGRYGGLLPAAQAPTDGRTAVELLRAVISSSKPKITVLTLGPLTNLAQSLEGNAGLVQHIDRVVAMAGAFATAGNVTLENDPAASASEWNVYVDPAAAQAVLDSGVPVTFVPIDSQVAVDPYVLRAFATATSPAGQKIGRLLASDPFFVSGGFFLWDPLAAGAAIDPSLVDVRRADVSVNTTGAEAGRTVEGSGHPAQIAVVHENDAFLATLTGVIDHKSLGTFSRTPTVSIDASTSAGCKLSATNVTSGAAVIELPSAGTAVAIGSLIGNRSDEEIDQYLATSPAGPPDWFPLLSLLLAPAQPTSTYIDLPLGNYDVVCFVTNDTKALRTTGRVVLHILASDSSP